MNYCGKKGYIYANSEILAQYDGDWRMPLDCRYFYLHDRLGSVRQIIDCGANVVKLYTYNPFGELIEKEPSDEGQAPSNCFMFTGQWYDNEIGQYYLRARQYDPHLYRFISRDPILGDFKEPITLHKYLYCGNDPLNRLDLTGDWSLTVGASVAAEVSFKLLNSGGWMEKTTGSTVGNALNTIGGLQAYYMVILPLLEYGLFENDYAGPAGTAGIGITFAHDEDKSFNKGWEIGPTWWAAGGGALMTGSSAAVMVDLAYSPDAQNIKDLVGPFLEYGGSLSTPPTFWGINCFSTSYSYGYNEYNEKIRLFTGSFGWGTPGKYGGWGGEGHIFKGRVGRWDPWFKN